MPANLHLLPQANFTRRLFAALYDALLLLAVLFLASALALTVYTQLNPQLSGEQAALYLNHSPFFRGYLVLCAFLYYAYFWHKSGQTLGMKVWKIRVQSLDTQNPSYLQCAIKFITAAFGLNLISILFSPTDTAFNDKLSKTEVVRLD